ncbi:MAG: hypothetical protein AAFZ67_00440 [Planctomycetota bacterium]
MRTLTLSTLLGLAASGAALAQNEATPEDVLGGPSVEVEAETPTLVERDLEGQLRPLETRAEVAAIGLLGLTNDEREAVDLLILERAALADEIASDNRQLLNQLRSAASAASNEEGVRGRRGGASRELMGQLREALAPMLRQEPLVDHFAAALPEASQEQYKAIVAEWYEASSAEARAGMNDGMNDRPARARRGGAMQAVRIEIRNALKRGSDERTDRLDRMIAALELTPEQEGTVREMIREFNQANKDLDDADKADRSKLMQSIFNMLEPEQRRKAIRNLREQR